MPLGWETSNKDYSSPNQGIVKNQKSLERWICWIWSIAQIRRIEKRRELAWAYHPDAGGDEIVKELTESYNYLSDKISSTVEFLG